MGRGGATRLAIAAALLLALPGPALGGPSARPSWPRPVREPARSAAPARLGDELSRPVALRLRLPVSAPAAGGLDWLRLPQPGPDTLSLRLDLHPLLALTLAADLDQELPRLDAVDGDTYFTVGCEVRLGSVLTVFLEDFQPASGVVGGRDPLEPVALRSWDGHQLGLGLRAVWGPWRLEGGPVLAALSPSGRRESLGARLALAWSF